MKLLFDLPARDEAALLAAMSEGEPRMYCVPYDFEGDQRVKGFMVITDRHIYKLLDGEVITTWDLSEMSDFTAETFYGACGFFAAPHAHKPRRRSGVPPRSQQDQAALPRR